MIICVNGRARAGKDTVSDVFVKKLGFKKISFADPIKEICSKAFDIPLNSLYDDDLKDAPFAEPIFLNIDHAVKLLQLLEEAGCTPSNAQSNTLIAEGLAMQFVSPRNLLQKVGTDLCRKYLGDTVWIDIFKRKIGNSEGNFVIADGRFLNERSTVKDLNGYNFLVIRPSLGIPAPDAHESELLAISPELIDITIINDSTVNSLQREVETWWHAKMKAKGWS